jgi:hypothetical protein
MHMTIGITFSHIRVQNNQDKESKVYPFTFSKKRCDNNSKSAMLTVKISGDYYNSKRYEIPGGYYFDTQKADSRPCWQLATNSQYWL